MLLIFTNLFYFINIKSIMTSSWLNLDSNSKPWTSPLQLFQRSILLNIASILVLATNKVVKKLTQLFFSPFYFKDKNQLPIGDPEKLKYEKKNKQKKEIKWTTSKEVSPEIKWKLKNRVK